jgi:molybdopterin-guanine dinucleotide biosynthesis protein A
VEPQQTGADGPAIGAVVLAGGFGTRLGGADKASVEIAGSTLLERSIDALIDVREIVVVGDPVPTSRPVTFTREDPAGGGPAAGLLAGLRAFVTAPGWVVVLAVDMPGVTAATIRRLSAAQGRDGAVLVDDSGRRQPLCAVYVTASLERNRPSYEEEHGMSMRSLVDGLDLGAVPAVGIESHDVDSWADLRRLREHLDPGA